MNNRINSNRFWLVLGVVVMLGLIGVGCAGQPAPAPTTAPQATSAPPAAAQPTSAPAAQVKLRFWMQQDNLLQAAMTDLIASFQKANPNIQVQLEAFPFAEYHQKVSTAFAGGDPPDVFWMDIRTPSFAQQGVLLPLDQYITDQNRKDYIPAAWTKPCIR